MLVVVLVLLQLQIILMEFQVITLEYWELHTLDTVYY